MKVIKSFVITLVIVLAIGGIYIFHKDKVNDATESIGTTVKETVNESVGNAVDGAKKKVVKTIVNEAIDQYSDNADENVKQVLDSVTEEDKSKISEIIADNLDMDSIDDVKDYVTDKDVDGLMKYAEEKLTEQDYSEFTAILEKYSDEAQKLIEDNQ